MSVKKNAHTIDYAKLKSEYDLLLPKLEKLCHELSIQLSSLLQDAGVATGFPIQTRVKTQASVLRKIESSPGKYKNIASLQDLVGIRIILQFKRDVERVIGLLTSNLKVQKEYDARARLAEDQFGYSSVHCVVTMPEEWTAVPTMMDLRNLRAEIQIRTLAQHIWAEASHKLQYKQDATVPDSVLRSIYRVSALLETVDLEFDRVLSERDAYIARLDMNETESLLNVDVLAEILNTSLPDKNKDQDEDYAELISDLNAFDINTLADLNELIQDCLSEALVNDTKAVKDLQNNDGVGFLPPGPGRLERGVFYTHTGLVRVMLEIRYGDKWNNYIRQVID